MQQREVAVAAVRGSGPRTRSATRFAVRLPVELMVAGGSLRGSTRNLSLGGALIEAPLVIACRTRLVVRLSLPGTPEPLTFEGMVRRVEPDAVGVSFERLGSQLIWSLGDFLESL
jgi:hypothetical protein